MRGTSRVALTVFAAASVVACGSTASSPRPVTATASRPQPPRPAGRPIGVPERVRARGASLAIAVTQVIDPLRGSGAALLPGTRAVGVLVRIRNRGPGVYDSSSTGDVSVVASAGPASVASASRGPCMTMDRDFDNQISPGETRRGCVTFAVASGARILAVRFSANGGGAGVGRWRGP